MKARLLTFLILLMPFGAFAQNDDNVSFWNYHYGHNFLTGQGDKPQDFNKAVKYFLKNVNGTDYWSAASITDLGYCYYNGLGVSVDKRKALELFQKAAPLGEEFAQLYLMYFYSEGILVKKDKKMAEYWYSKCSERLTDEEKTQYILELMYPKLRWQHRY